MYLVHCQSCLDAAVSNTWELAALHVHRLVQLLEELFLLELPLVVLVARPQHHDLLVVVLLHLVEEGPQFVFKFLSVLSRTAAWPLRRYQALLLGVGGLCSSHVLGWEGVRLRLVLIVAHRKGLRQALLAGADELLRACALGLLTIIILHHLGATFHVFNVLPRVSDHLLLLDWAADWLLLAHPLDGDLRVWSDWVERELVVLPARPARHAVEDLVVVERLAVAVEVVAHSLISFVGRQGVTAISEVFVQTNIRFLLIILSRQQHARVHRRNDLRRLVQVALPLGVSLPQARRRRLLAAIEVGLVVRRDGCQI